MKAHVMVNTSHPHTSASNAFNAFDFLEQVFVSLDHIGNCKLTW